jgi:hypothetical protein
MKMLAEYLENAAKFERMAVGETDPKLKADLDKQAVAYRKLAVERAKQHGYEMPPESKGAI